MTAKIKSHPRFDTRRQRVAKPKGISDKAFARVYWPFIPVVIALTLLLTVAVKTVPLHHLTGRVLAYQTSKNAQELLKDTNLQRRKNDESPLKLNDLLTQAAQAKAADMAKRDYWSHDTPDGVAPWSFVTATGYDYESLGENLAAGFHDDDAVVNAWMASPHHRANILNKSYTEVGFGYANNPNYVAGGGPMTIVVAFYGQPVSIALPAAPSQTGATSLNIGSSSTTASRVATVSSNPLAIWAPTILILGAFAAIALFVEKHRRYIQSTAAAGERYILRHPMTDLGLLVIAGLVFLLIQTAGYIQ